MKKIFLLFILLIAFLLSNVSYSQGFTPPKTIIGLSLDGNFATNDAHGTNFMEDTWVYGMIWGRGVSVYSKFGLGLRMKHRITVSASYNKMVNNIQNSKIPFFVGIPGDGSPYTDNSILSGAVGYEYAFNPRCKSKQYVGFAFTGNYISSTSGSFYQFNPALRFGLQVTTGYEFVLDRNYQTGLSIGLKYNLMNIFGSNNGPNNLNDGAGEGGSGYWRRIGMLSLNLGINYYMGVQPYRF